MIMPYTECVPHSAASPVGNRLELGPKSRTRTRVKPQNSAREESGFRTRFGSADGGESVPDVGRVVDGQSGGLNDDDGRGDLHRQAPVVHETQQVDQRESDAREDPEDGHQVRDEDQRHADNGRHRQAQVADQLATNHLDTPKIRRWNKLND